MASSYKTTRGLNRWQEGDKPSMADFNADNQVIGELMETLENKLEKKADAADVTQKLGQLEQKLISRDEVTALIQEALKPYYSLKGDNRVILPDRADLNDYKQVGMIYVGNGNDSVATMANTPFKDYSFTMTVEPALASQAYIVQTAKMYNNGMTYSRTYTTTLNTWSSWTTK